MTSSTSAARSTTAAIRIAPAKPKRVLGTLVVGLMVVVIGALISGVASAQAGHRSSVLAIAKAVPSGQVIQSSDVEVVRISADPQLRPMLDTQRSSVVGHVAAVSLIPGTLLTSAAIGPSTELGNNDSQVGIALKAGQYPPGLAAGQHVRVIGVDTATSTLVDAAVVVNIGTGDANSSGSAVVTLQVPLADLNAVAAANATGHISLGLVSK